MNEPMGNKTINGKMAVKERNEEMGNELSTAMSEQGILTIKGIR